MIFLAELGKFCNPLLVSCYEFLLFFKLFQYLGIAKDQPFSF